MSITQPSVDREAAAFLSHYINLVTDELYNEMMESIKPRLRKAAREAAEKLKPTIQTYADHMEQKLVAHLIVKGLDHDQ
jgi:hypothetical protein